MVQSFLRQVRNQPRLFMVAVLALLYLTLFLALDHLRFEPMRDEKHFWPTSQRFAEQFPPKLELLRDYQELNTPLPFVIFGAVERAFGGGIAAGRLVNLLISLGMALIIALAIDRLPARAILACAGLILFPYFLGSSVMLYTDIIAAGCVLAGVVLHQRGRPWLGMIMFTLAIASRQYAVAFPLAIAVYEALAQLMTRSIPGAANDFKISRWLAPLLSVMSLGGWFLFFGGLAPRAAIEAQNLSTAQAARIFPGHSLYFLACIGVYFVLSEALLFRNIHPLRSGLRAPLPWALAGVVVLGFVLAPPLRNVDYPNPSMGYLDKAARLALSDPMRMIVFALLALLAVFRFHKMNLAFFLVMANALVMLKAHIGWDKYDLSLLAVLWWLKARGSLDDESTVGKQPDKPIRTWAIP